MLSKSSATKLAFTAVALLYKNSSKAQKTNTRSRWDHEMWRRRTAYGIYVELMGC